LLVSAPLLAEDLRSDEGVSIPVPQGWAQRTGKRGSTTVLALEAVEPNAAPDEFRSTIVVNSLETQAMTQEKAFQETRELLPKPGEIVDRPSGRYLRVDYDYTVDTAPHPRKLMSRLYAGLREKRLYFFILTTRVDAFDRDTAAIDSVVDGAKFFTPSPKPVSPATPPEAVAPAPPARPETTTAPATPSRPAKPEPKAAARATDPSPPKEATPGAFVGATPSDGPRIDTSKSEGAPVVSASAPPAAPLRKPGKTNVLGPRSLVFHDGELESDGRLAQNLVDPAATKGWCSSPGSARGRSKRLVFDLGRSTDVFRVAFDADCPEEPGFEGSGARDVAIQGSAVGDHGPWHELGRIVLERGKRDQSVDLPPNGTRWLRVEVLSNQGHPTLTQLMKVRAFEAEQGAASQPAIEVKSARTTDDGAFRVERLRLSSEQGGTPVPAVFGPGDTFWVYFKPRALRLDESGEYGLEVDLRLEDAEGKEQRSFPGIVNKRAKPPAPPLSPNVSLKVELPPTFRDGAYVVKLDIRDKEAGLELHESVPFEVKKPR
jgi:hypothetical protein